MRHSAEFYKEFHPRLHAMQLNMKFKSKFLVDFALFCLAYSQLPAMTHSAESTRICKYLGNIETKFENILGGLIGEKTGSR
jgi:hypothetical protein